MLEKIQIHPAIYPANGEISFRANAYVPPSSGMYALNSAMLSAEKSEIIPAITTEIIIAGPAIPATIPVTMKIPEPMIAPMPRAVAPNNPISRFR